MMKLLAGNGCPELAHQIAEQLHETLIETNLAQFSDGEIRFELLTHVRGDDVFIVQSTCAPTNDNIMELAVMADTLRRSASGRIIAVIPYYGYARQDRRPDHSRTPITSRLVADLLQAAGVDYVLTMDIHSEQQQGFFSVPFVNIHTTDLFVKDVFEFHNEDNLTVVSPDVGGVKRARALAKRLNDAPIAIIDKRRPEPGVAEVHHIIGNVKDRTCIIVDDLIDSAGTLSKASIALKEHGASKLIAYITHPVLSGNAIMNIEESALDELVVTDTIPMSYHGRTFIENTKRIRVVSVSELLSEAVHRIHSNKSISKMYNKNKELE